MTQTLDPLATSELVTTTYRRYLRSLLPIRDEAIAAALDEQIVASPLLTKGPFLEATPPYETGASVQELIDQGVLESGMETLGGPALPLDRPLYRHQDQAIRKAVAGRNLVVATGTGSGKTESFLLPILNTLAQEHSHGTLGPGVRALLLYPMNALANDQMKRLRKLLAATPHFTFGRYTGDTKERPKDARDSFQALNPGEPLLKNELLSREEMRAAPPHLLLTNYAMLEYLLLRPADLDLFEGEHGGTWRFVIVDEAHVYDGAKAAEMAMLLRRLHDRVAHDRRLHCLATSATIGDDNQAVTRFATQLFASPFEWVDGDPARQDLVGPTRRPTTSGLLWGPLGGADYRKLAELAHPEAEIARLAAERGSVSGTADYLLAREKRMSDLRSALAGDPKPFAELASRVFEPDDDPAQSLAALVAVGSKVRDESGSPVLSARYHLFTRATEGAYTCLTPAGPHVSLGRRQQCEQCSGASFEIGACQRCGAVYLTGSVEIVDGKPTLVPQKREGAPVWMLLDDSSDVIDEDEDTFDDATASVDLQPAMLCTGCGAVHLKDQVLCCTGVVARQVQVVHAKGSARNLKKCVRCGARGSTVRRFESGQDAAVAVVSTALYQALPPEEEHAAKPGGGRKLLLFSDSRQRAAFFAPYLQNSYGVLQHRRLVWEGLRIAADEGEIHVDDLIDGVTKAATDVGVFPHRMSPSMKKRDTALWVMQELVAIDDRQSLEGRGLLRVMPAREPSWLLTPALKRLGLGEQETWNLLSELTRTLRQSGVLTMPDNVAADDEAFAPRRGPIYVPQGGSDARRKILSLLPTSGRNRRLDYLERVLQAAGSNAKARDILAECWNVIYAPEDGWLTERRPPGLGVVRQVNHEWLDLEVGAKTFQCTTCRRLAPVAVRGVCPTLGCQGTMTEHALPGKDDDTDHYRRIYRSMLPIPLVATEHTAQWTGEEAARIQQEFLRGDVNALSCSTTFELGVDVGELQSVVMRNMPPNTANYVQRAGRAGRRTSSAALVVTYAQRASHDLSRYQNPIDMIAGTVRAPYVPLGNERIDRRHAHSIALAAFFRYGKEILGREWTKAGQFFLPGDDGETAPATMVGPFLTPVSAAVQESLGRVIPPSVQKEIGVADGGAWAEKLAELLEEVRGQFAEEIAVLEERRQWAFSERKDSLGAFFGRVADTIRDRNLIGYLASRNVLPKYGFPVDTVDLMTAHAGNRIGEKLELSRDLTSAIYEYAPGGEIVAGGKLWKSAGLRRRPGHELTGRQFAVCGHCEGIQVTDDQIEATCPKCGLPYVNTDRRGRYVIPEFGFLAARDPQNPGMTPPQRSWNGATYVLNLAAEPEKHEWRAHGSIAVTARAGARGRLLALSEGPTGRGFLICPACGWGQANLGKPPKSHEDPLRAKECDYRLQPRYLAHAYETDLLELTFAPSVLQESDSSTLQSLLAAILEGAADRLQIAREDIGGTLYPGPGGRRALVIYDTVPAGAGNALRIARSLDAVLAGAAERVAECDCGEETSCYGCLRNYRNQWIHDLLRRDRALQVLRRAGQLQHAQQPGGVSAPDRGAFPELPDGTVLTDTFTGQAKAVVLGDGRVLMHAENYGDVQQAADAVDYNVDALDFWATETPSGLRTLRHTVQLPRTSACLYRIRSLTSTPAPLCRAFGISTVRLRHVFLEVRATVQRTERPTTYRLSLKPGRCPVSDIDRSIDGVAKTVAEILEKKYSIDYYQREYKWESKQLKELVADLTTKFIDLHEPDHVRKDVAKYPGYFLGSIIVSQKGSQPFIVDGQQRLTSLTLLLTFLRGLQRGREDVVDVDQLIFSEKFGEKSFNLDVPDRVDCMESLFEHGDYEPPADAPESVHTLVNRYDELDSLFPDELREKALPFFIDWLKDRVQLVQITAYADDDAYAIFETMNDRGLKLTPADMLKGYLLANMEDGKPRTKANDLWRRRLRNLAEQSDDAGSDFLKTWLRSQYSTKIRERKRGARPEDWDRIGTEFHRWLRADHERVGLITSADFYSFVARDFDFYSRQYERIVGASSGVFHPDNGLRFIRYNADLGFTLQDQLLLAPLRVDDDQQTIDRKLEIVGRFTDILLAWRIWNFRATAYSTMQYAMFNVMRDIRGLGVHDLAQMLWDQLKSVNETFDSNDDLYVHQQNRGQLHKILARITDYITVASGGASIYAELINTGKVRYEVEHIWANHPERHSDEFAHDADFSRHRNRIGDLLLLPRQFNASYNDDPYEKKLPHYFGQNLLAASLNSLSYEKNPGFVSFIKSSGLPFKPYEEFKAKAITERGNLYRGIAKKVWDPDDLLATAEGWG